MRLAISTLLLAVGLLSAKAQAPKKAESITYVLLSTSFGEIKIALYNETPLHRDNFVKLVKESYFDGTLFHRVIKEFMIQGGDPDSKTAQAGQQLGNGGPGYTIPAEFNDKFYHKKGALSAARTADQINPKKESSGSQFYIVQGKKYTEEDLKRFEENINQERMNGLFQQLLANPDNAELAKVIDGYVKVGNKSELDFLLQQIQPTLLTALEKNGKFTYSPEAIKAYSTLGGTPHLDGNYTVFGEVIQGLDVIDKIAAVPTQPGDRPLENIVMTMKIVKK